MKNTDAVLIHRTLNGDDNAFAELVKKYQKQVHALIWRKIGDFHIAEELTQDVFLKAYQGLATLKKPQSFVSWLYVIASNDCSTWLRKKRLWTQSLEDTSGAKLEKATYSGYVIQENERTSSEAQRDVVQKLLAKLQESERTVMTLHYFGEMTCKEISEFLGVSVGAIKSRLKRARHRLKKEEPMIREALDHFQITPHLTENIMREIARIKPIAPSGNKPFVPWAIAVSAIAVVFLMLGIGSQYLAYFQQPYSFEASSEMTVDIVEAPFVLNLASKPDVRTQLGNANASDKRNVSNQRPDDTSALVAEAEAEEIVENYSQWKLPKAAKVRLGKGDIRGIQFSPDGTQLAVSSNIGVWLYDVQSGKEKSLIAEMCGSPVFSPDGGFLAHSGHDPYSSLGGSRWEKGVKLWEVATGHKISFPNMPPAAAALRFSDDGKVLVSLNKSRYTISRLDIETGKSTENALLGERPGYVHLETYALTEDKIAIGMYNGDLELWDTRTGKKLSTLRENVKKLEVPDELVGLIEADNSVFALAFSPDGTRLASGSRDTTVQLWNITRNHVPITLQKHTGWPTELAFSPDGKLLASGGTDNTVQLWDTDTGESLATFTEHLSDIRALAFSPDSTTLASGSSDGTIRFWNTETRQPLPTHITEHPGGLHAVTLKDSSTLASVGGDGIITLWDIKTFEHITIQTKNAIERTLSTDWIGTFVFSPDGRKLASSALSLETILDDVLRLTDVSTGHELATFPVSGAEMVFSPDGKSIAYSRRSNKIHLLNTETGKIVDMLLSDPNANPEMHHRPEVRSLIFSPDGKKLVNGTKGGRVQMWDVATGVALTSFFEEQPPIDKRYRDPIVALAFSSDGSTIAVGSVKRIRLLGSPKQTHFKEVSHSENVWSEALAFSPDNTVIVRAVEGAKIQLWDIATGNTLTTLDGHLYSVKTLMFLSDGKTLVSAGEDGTILLWDWDKVLQEKLKL